MGEPVGFYGVLEGGDNFRLMGYFLQVFGTIFFYPGCRI